MNNFFQLSCNPFVQVFFSWIYQPVDSSNLEIFTPNLEPNPAPDPLYTCSIPTWSTSGYTGQRTGETHNILSYTFVVISQVFSLINNMSLQQKSTRETTIESIQSFGIEFLTQTQIFLSLYLYNLIVLTFDISNLHYLI